VREIVLMAEGDFNTISDLVKQRSADLQTVIGDDKPVNSAGTSARRPKRVKAA
jgi:hypothetical protein